ncbi:MAG: hypothetical protein HND44_10560 [Chloroflexi bacterium]|nr:hypothetical protein [Ardenticatenaceae bacterium]MBL1128919.1 hypothetical protein [Chloroflexota bacterium]NOG34998.1 hypothetical protein [Chloroflexota bacterium]GIK58107.1 MAG: hypothetical protein BroJett015_37700 [Chloroflexota bacterium]
MFKRPFTRIVCGLVGAGALLMAVLHLLHAQPQQTNVAFGYGFNVAAWDVPQLQAMGFNWMKVFNGPGSRLPVSVLMRIDANVNHFNNLNAFGNSVAQLAQQQKGYVDAYEIGNEPNLDASYGWAAPPIAADYVAVLCKAYDRIKAIDPDALVISAGLAPTGRVQGNWNGHPGHNGLYQDEREFFLEFVAAGGGNCLDGVGYHPYGYSADFDATPDAPSGDPTQNCANGFCFRGAEKLYELMQTHGLGHKKMWATEFGWITQPPDHCLSDPSWQGRLWQIVSPQKQAENLVGAYEYATTHWPWMGAMFIFNLNFNQAPIYPECEQMRFYGVMGRPAEQALANMPKVSPPATGVLEVSPLSLTTIITPGQLPLMHTAVLHLHNSGATTLTYTIAATPTAPLALTLPPTTTGALAAGQNMTMPVQLSLPVSPIGLYTGTVTAVSASSGLTATQTIPVRVYVWQTIHHVYLPVVLRN